MQFSVITYSENRHKYNLKDKSYKSQDSTTKKESQIERINVL